MITIRFSPRNVMKLSCKCMCYENDHQYGMLFCVCVVAQL